MKKYKTDSLYLIRLNSVKQRYDENLREMIYSYRPIDKQFIMYKLSESEEGAFDKYYIFEKGVYLDYLFRNEQFGLSIAEGQDNICKLNFIVNDLPKKLSEKQILDLQNEINYKRIIAEDPNIDVHY